MFSVEEGCQNIRRVLREYTSFVLYIEEGETRQFGESCLYNTYEFCLNLGASVNISVRLHFECSICLPSLLSFPLYTGLEFQEEVAQG